MCWTHSPHFIQLVADLSSSFTFRHAMSRVKELSDPSWRREALLRFNFSTETVTVDFSRATRDGIVYVARILVSLLYDAEHI